MENKDRAGSLTASPWIKRESPERRAHAASRESSASPSRNAVVVESVVEIDIPRKASARKSARRGTSVDEEYEKITKVTGKQFIPAGEVELEPMPLLDEFEFSSNYFQTIFLEDQRRTKEIRRKQYGDRNYDKVKDFVMYRYEALRSEASQILKNHYSQHGRPMTKKEISDAATQLKVEDTIFQRIHDDYRAWWIKNRRQIRAQREFERSAEFKNADGTGYQSDYSGSRGHEGTQSTIPDHTMNRTGSQRETIGETEDEAERKRQELLQLQKRSRLARLAEKRDPNALADMKRSSGGTSDLPLGMALTERSNRLLKLEKQKKKALHESENLRQQLKDMKSKNDTLDRQLSKESLDRSKPKSKQSSPVKIPRKTPEKQPRPVQQNIDDQLIKKIESLQGHIKDAYRQSSLDKHKKDKECEKLRENLWMAKAEEEGLKRRLDKAERQLAEERELADQAEKLRRMQERSPQHLRHASADEGTDDDLSSEEEETRRLKIENERKERRRLRAERERQIEDEKAKQKAMLENLSAELDLQKLREEENKKRQEEAKRRHDEKRLKEIEDEHRRLEAARAELEKLKGSIDLERSKMFEQRKADSIRKLKGKRDDISASKISMSPRDSPDQLRGSRISPYSKSKDEPDSDDDDDQGRETVAVIDYDASAYEENHNEIYFEDEKGNLVKSAISGPHKDHMLQSALKKSKVPEGMDQKKLWQMYNEYCRKVTDNGRNPIKQKDADRTFQKFLQEAFSKKQ